VLKPTEGRLYIRDRPVDPERYSVQDAHDLRIEAVHQEKSLADKQPLWRNMFVGRQITNKLGFIDVRREKELANRMLLEQIGFRGAGIDADSTVGDLSGGERQGISIGRAMYFDADLIILDEPTVALALKEVQKVLDFVRGIKKSGRAAIYIEHNLAHVHELADRLVVLDRGEVVSEIRQGEMSLAELTRHLLDVQAAREGAAGP
jgi:simple sugar transport system ATP-binding protein